MQAVTDARPKGYSFVPFTQHRRKGACCPLLGACLCGQVWQCARRRGRFCGDAVRRRLGGAAAARQSFHRLRCPGRYATLHPSSLFMQLLNDTDSCLRHSELHRGVVNGLRDCGSLEGSIWLHIAAHFIGLAIDLRIGVDYAEFSPA